MLQERGERQRETDRPISTKADAARRQTDDEERATISLERIIKFCISIDRRIQQYRTTNTHVVQPGYAYVCVCGHQAGGVEPESEAIAALSDVLQMDEFDFGHDGNFGAGQDNDDDDEEEGFHDDGNRSPLGTNSNAHRR